MFGSPNKWQASPPASSAPPMGQWPCSRGALDDLAGRPCGVSLALSGSHGLEVLRPGERRPDMEPVRECRGLSGAFGEFKALARGFGLLIERKPGSVARGGLHGGSRGGGGDAWAVGDA